MCRQPIVLLGAILFVCSEAHLQAPFAVHLAEVSADYQGTDASMQNQAYDAVFGQQSA